MRMYEHLEMFKIDLGWWFIFFCHHQQILKLDLLKFTLFGFSSTSFMFPSNLPEAFLGSWESSSISFQVGYSRQQKAESKFFSWELNTTQTIRKSKEGRQNAPLLPSPTKKQIEIEDLQSKLQCIDYIYVYVYFLVYMYIYIFSTPLLCLICMSTNRFQLNAREKGNIPCDDLLKSSLYLFDNGF